jgi:hypothetical protein
MQQALFDLLEVPQRSRTAGAWRRLARLMRELGWSPVKARGLTQGGFRDQVRGYARDVRDRLIPGGFASWVIGLGPPATLPEVAPLSWSLQTWTDFHRTSGWFAVIDALSSAPSNLATALRLS